MVDTQDVQDSRLLKDTIVLGIPEDGEKFYTVIVRCAANKLKSATAALPTLTQHPSMYGNT